MNEKWWERWSGVEWCEEHSVWAHEKVSHETVKHCLIILIILIRNYTLLRPNTIWQTLVELHHAILIAWGEDWPSPSSLLSLCTPRTRLHACNQMLRQRKCWFLIMSPVYFPDGHLPLHRCRVCVILCQLIARCHITISLSAQHDCLCCLL